MISVNNAVEAAIKAAFAPVAANEIFCVTDGRDYTMNELVTIICSALGRHSDPKHIPLSVANIVGGFGDWLKNKAHIPFPINTERIRKLSQPLTFSCKKAQTALLYKPVETLEEGIQKEVNWLFPGRYKSILKK